MFTVPDHYLWSLVRSVSWGILRIVLQPGKNSTTSWVVPPTLSKRRILNEPILETGVSKEGILIAVYLVC